GWAIPRSNTGLVVIRLLVRVIPGAIDLIRIADFIDSSIRRNADALVARWRRRCARRGQTGRNDHHPNFACVFQHPAESPTPSGTTVSDGMRALQPCGLRAFPVRPRERVWMGGRAV